MSGLKALFGRQYPPLVMARSIGLNLVNQNALLKRFFIQRAINTGA
jgi:2-polyprenyl-6-methoxyphenol hydroxylase-like FAD-dependent oxidoreductase